MPEPPLVAIVGPTGVGKTSLAIRLAQEFDGEIVSGDSRQVYVGMDIGTAKPSGAELAAVLHHLVDIAPPDRTVSLAEFQALAYGAIHDIVRRGRQPFLVGGTGQYMWAVIEGWQVPRVPPNLALRAELTRRAESEGPATLHAELQLADAAAAERIDARNVRRVVRALEVYYTTGEPISQVQAKRPPPYRVLVLGLTMERAALYERIDARVDAMLAAGLESEVRRLVAQGYGFELPAMSALGYIEFEPVLAGSTSVQEAAAAIKRNTRRFVRHQANWFRPNDPRIHWLDAARDPFPAGAAIVDDWLTREPT